MKADTLAGEPIVARLTRAPANDAPIGGLKVVTENGWFAARPSGTEDVYKLYAESFKGRGAPRAHPGRGAGDRDGGAVGLRPAEGHCHPEEPRPSRATRGPPGLRIPRDPSHRGPSE